MAVQAQQTKKPTASATAPQAATRAKRGSGPFVIMYSDGDKHDYKRPPTSVKAVVVKNNKTGVMKPYTVTDTPEALQLQCTAFTLAKRKATTLINHLRENPSADIHRVCDTIYLEFSAGRLYSKGEGKGRGRAFDAAPYAYAMQLFRAEQHRQGVKKDGKVIPLMSDADKDRWALKLASEPSEKRNERVKSMNNNQYTKRYILEYRAKHSDRPTKEALEADLF